MPRAPRGPAPAALTVPSDPDSFFREFFPAQYARDPERYGTADTPGAAVFHVDGSGSWSVRITRSTLAVERGAPADTRLTIAVSRPDFDAVFVRRTQDEVARTGTISELSRDAFVPLFVTPKRLAIVERARGTLRFDLEHDGYRRALSITPGAPSANSEPRATIRVALDDFLRLLSRKRNAKLLFVTGRLSVKGDLRFALHMSGLVS